MTHQGCSTTLNSQRRLIATGTAIALYALLAIGLTWPLAAHFGTHVPGDGGDDPALTWNLWWVKHALLQGHDLFRCDYLFFPIGVNLAFYTLTTLNGALSIPLQELLGLVPAANVLLLSSFVLSALGAYLLGRAIRLKPAASFLLGVFYAFCAPRFFYAALGQFNIASAQWLPFAALYITRFTDPQRRYRSAALAGLFLALQSWAELTYAAFLSLFLAMFLAWRWGARVRQKALGEALRETGCVLLAGALVMLATAPLLLRMLSEIRAEGDFTCVDGGFADAFSADVAGFLFPTELHPLLGRAIERFSSIQDRDKAQQLYFGWSIWILAAIGLSKRRDRQDRFFWLLCTAIFLWLSLGPVLKVNGTRFNGVPMPFRLLQDLPLWRANRYPSRFGVPLVLCLGVVAAAGWETVSRRMKRPRAALALFAFLYMAENLSIPLPLSDMHVPSIYEHVRAQPGDFAILDLPIGWRNGFRITGAHSTAIMFAQYYQTYHGKRLLGGNTSRNPELQFQFFTEAPVLRSLIAMEAGRSLPPNILAEDKALAACALWQLGVKLIVLHEEHTPHGVVEYVEDVLPVRLIAKEGPDRLYRVEGACNNTELDLRLALAEGWSARGLGSVLAQRAKARLLVPASPAPAAKEELHLELAGIGASSKVKLTDESGVLGTCSLDGGWTSCTVPLRNSGGQAPIRSLFLVTTRPSTPHMAFGGASIGQTKATAPVDIVVRSAGEEFGDFAHIYVNGIDFSPNQRGYNVVTIDRATGRILAIGAFDTHLDDKASQALAQFLSTQPPGAIIAAAAADEASRLLQEDAVQALRSVGAIRDLRGCFRCAHALVGIKGASPGQAAEELNKAGVAQVVIGEGLTEPRAFFRLRAVRVLFE